jgi:hypothetical protein
MKVKIPTHLSLLVLMTMAHQISYAQNKITQSDTTKIKEVVQSETELFYARRFDDWQKLWKHSNDASWIYSGFKSAVEAKEGWDSIKFFLREFVKKNPAPQNIKSEKINYRFRFTGKSQVWLTFDAVRTGEGPIHKTHEVRILEKENNDWKIVCAAIFVTDEYPAESSN